MDYWKSSQIQDQAAGGRVGGVWGGRPRVQISAGEVSQLMKWDNRNSRRRRRGCRNSPLRLTWIERFGVRSLGVWSSCVKEPSDGLPGRPQPIIIILQKLIKASTPVAAPSDRPTNQRERLTDVQKVQAKNLDKPLKPVDLISLSLNTPL